MGLLMGGKRIRKGSEDGNGGSNDSVAFHDFLKNNRRNNNDDDSLGSVQDGRSDGADMARERKGFEKKGKNDMRQLDQNGVVFCNVLVPTALTEFLMIQRETIKQNSNNCKK
jgi:hypothetical protein